MSTNIPWSKRHKGIAGKSCTPNGKENVYAGIKVGKFGDGKSDVGKKKGLFANSENRSNDAARSAPVRKSSIGEAQFRIYCDTDDKNTRSRSRVRKYSMEKAAVENDIKGRNDRTIEDASSIRAMARLFSRNRSASPKLRALPQRARSASNSRKRLYPGGNDRMSSDSSRRSCSESRKLLGSADADIIKIKCLTNDVKKRTLSSIQAWKEKMRRQQVCAVTKHNSRIYPNAPNVNRVYTKINLRKSDCNDRVKSTIASNKAPVETFKNQAKDLVENVKGILTDYTMRTLKSVIDDAVTYISHEYTMILQNKNVSETGNNVSTSTKSNRHGGDNQLIPINEVTSTTITPLDGPSALLLTPAKVRYEKRGKVCTSVATVEDSDDIYTSVLESDYSEDLLDTECKRDESAPKLSFRFLHENINAKQRMIVVGYLIRLGVHCHFPSHIIYQTVKMFDVAIDRIFVETDNIQLMALACLWITLKREATNHSIPSATVILRLAKDLYVGQEKNLITYEKNILLALKFNLWFADPFSLLFYYIRNVKQYFSHNVTQSDMRRVYFCSSYLIDVTMLDERLCNTSVCILAMAATELSFSSIYPRDIGLNRMWYRYWRSNNLLMESEDRTMLFVKQAMIQLVLETDKKHYANVIYKKYQRSKNGRVADFLLSKMKALLAGEVEESLIFD